ncbi:MAG: uroporphyrinogen-III C-methyltransferase [Bariatricus sp.]
MAIDKKIRETDMEQQGKVWLAGAGPGDAGLLTIKTRKIMEEADTIVYDALVSTEILSLIPHEKEMIDVGKRQGNHPVPQKEINQILLENAMMGKKVLRLKGGDPFVFGRGGEEAEALAEHGISFEVIPGVTSAAAVPAYAGIPVTHRDYASSFHVITGHPRKDGSSRIDYPALVSLKGTLVFLMGITSLGRICRGLMEAGMDPKTMAAVISKGTTAGQKKVVSTLEHLEEQVICSGIGTPALIVVGPVCSLAGSFAWREALPLNGKQIVVTRPRENRGDLAGWLRKLGAQVIEMPTICTEKISPNERLHEAMKTFGSCAGQEWLVFTSAIGVRVFFQELRNMRIDIRQLFGGPADVKIAAIGAATERELAMTGIFADVVPENFNAERLGYCIAEKAAAGSHVVIVRAGQGSPELLPPLTRKGLIVEDIPLYTTVYAGNDAVTGRVKHLLENGEIDMVTFTSGSTVRGFMASFGETGLDGLCAACIGEQTRREAERCMKTSDGKSEIQFLTAEDASEEGLLQAICMYFTKDTKRE